MKQSLRKVTTLVAAGALAGIGTSAIATDLGFIDIGGNFSTIDVPRTDPTSPSQGTSANGINNAGQVVGFFINSVPFGQEGFLKTGDTFDRVAIAPRMGLPASANGINDAGSIVGWYTYGLSFYIPGFIRGGGGTGDFDVPGAGCGEHGVFPQTVPNGVNNARQIVGTFIDCQGSHSFLETNGTFSTIAVAGASDTVAKGINNAGQIVGFFSDSKGTHGFLDVNGTFTTIDVPGALETRANGINNAGQIVGSFTDRNGIHGFLDSGGVFSTIDFPRAKTFTSANGINDAGHIVGTVTFVPEPSFLTLLCIGLLGLASRRKHLSAIFGAST